MLPSWLPDDLVLVFFSVTCPGIRFLWLLCSGGTPIHHLASRNPGTPLRHAQTERLPNLCLVTQQVCGEAKTHTVSRPQWVGMQAQPCATSMGPGHCEQLLSEDSWRPLPSGMCQIPPAPAAGLPNHYAVGVLVLMACLKGRSRKGWPTALDFSAYDE